ncbi:ArsR/SmtB family transcription factor [Nonomuraea sp. NPDC050663]|uniref:ArsR/SmtB family transcription factor n=1 Tax=Nonomuraea sp. NPDC050663 TaxID=3364370 RepID=UPI0037B6B684
MDEELEIADAVQYHAFGHPLRQKILFALGQDPATISQLAGALDCQKGSVAHHLKVLREAGLVRPGQTRRVRGGTEQYFERAARRFHFTGPAATGQIVKTLQVLADGAAASPSDPFVVMRHVRLSAAQLERLTETIKEVVALEETEPSAPRHAIVVGVYELPSTG